VALMLRRAIAAAAALALSACAAAPPEPAFAPALFVARDADSTMYLFGTIHLRRAGGEWGGENTKAALAGADELWTEMAMTPEAESEVQQLVLTLGMSPDRPLASRLTEAEYAQLSALARAYGVAPEGLNLMQPWLAALTLSMLPMVQAGYDPKAGVDEAVNAQAGQAIGRRSFETAAQQIGFLAHLSEAAQMQFLREAIAEAAEGPAALDELSLAWERGDLVTLERLVIDEFKAEAPEAYDIIFRQRNRAWTEALMAELEGEGVDFVAVGAGHMLGEDGLVAMLRARGVSVERVN
jgi:uncharacterized protein